MKRYLSPNRLSSFLKTPFVEFIDRCRAISRLNVFAVVLLMASASSATTENPRILMVTPEQGGIFQTGGLAHAPLGLASALNEAGAPTEILMPYYLEMKTPAVVDTHQSYKVDMDWRDDGHGFRPHRTSTFQILKTADEKTNAKVPTIFLKHNSSEGEVNYFDNRSHGSGKKFYAPAFREGESFAAFAKATADYILNNNYDVVILNDWTAGLIALHLHEAKLSGKKTPKVIFAIHNLAYQGNFPKSLADFMGLDEKFFSIDGYEFHGQVSFLKAGIQYSDMVYTVSRQYASEIATARFGAGLDGLIRRKLVEFRMSGVLNGIINADWDPKLEKPNLKYTFSSGDLSGKDAGKAELQQSIGLPVASDRPLFIMTSRLAEQKGFEYLIDAIEKMALVSNAQWLIVGDGSNEYAEKLRALEHRFHDRVRYFPFSEALEKQATRYGDFFVNGAWFEPSGLNQFFALKNGTIPVVSSSGGLLDSVMNGKTGVLFSIAPGANGASYDSKLTAQNAFNAFEVAAKIYQEPAQFRKMQLAGMKQDHSWKGRLASDFRALLSYVLANGPERLKAQHVAPSMVRAPTPSMLFENMKSPRPGGLACAAYFQGLAAH
jgi:starch synthase